MEKLQGKIPEIRFPKYKDDWEHKKLSKLLSESKKLNVDLKYDKDEVLSVSGELGVVNQIQHLGRSYAGASVHNYGVVETGDIVYTKSPLKANPYGIIKLNKGKAGIVSTLYAVYKVNKENADGNFLDYYFSLNANTNRYLRPLVKKGAKNDMKINNVYVLHDRIFAPTIPEQTCIASFFTVLDKKIAELKQKKALLEQYKKGIMQKLFSQELRFKDLNGKDFPKWEKKKLGEVGDVKMCRRIFNEETLPVGEIPFFKIGSFGREPDAYISKDLYLDYRARFSYPKKGDILISAAGTIGRMVVYNGEDAYFQDSNIVWIDNDNSTVSNEFLFYILQIVKYNTEGGTIQRLYNNSLKSTKFSCPTLPEQTRIANFLSAIDEKINHCQMQIEKTEQWKKGLLQKMFV